MPSLNRLNVATGIRSILILAAITLLPGLPGCINRHSAPAHLRILFTTDTQGNFTPCGCAGGPRGGMERRSTAIRKAMEEAPGPVVLLDTGNFSTGLNSELEQTKTEYVVRAMAQIGYDAVNVGSMDAVRPRLAVQAYDRQGFRLTSAGYTYADEVTGEKTFSYPTRIVIERDGFRIGIVGSHLSDTLDEESLGFQNEPTVTGPELLELLNRVYVEERVGMVILISDLSSSWQQVRITASLFPLASVVIAGQSAPPELREEKRGSEIAFPVFAPRAASWGRSLGILDLELSKRGGILAYSLEYVDLNESIEKDPAFESMTEEYLAAIDREPVEVPQVRQAGYVGTAACRECHEREHESWAGSPHAEAWETLEEAGRLRESACIPCHVTGYTGSEFLPERLVAYELRGVGCEACHGPGQVHILYRRWLAQGSPAGGAPTEDLTDPIVLTPPEETCRACHVAPYDERWFYILKLEATRHE